MDKGGLVRPPRQDRSRQTLERILAVTRELLRERDFADISVDDIVQRAGSSKGSFYQRFADKDSLLGYLLEEEHEAAVAAWSAYLEPARWVGRPLMDVLDGFLDRLMEIYRDHSSLMRAYAGQVLNQETRIRTLSVQLTRHVLERLRRLVRERSEEVGHPDPERATAFLMTALITLLPPLILFPTPDLLPEPMTLDDLEDELRRMIKSYLGVASTRN